MRAVLITGAAGFVGLALATRMLAVGLPVQGATRRAVSPALADSHTVVVGEINGATQWDKALIGVSTVVHLAARVHVMRDVATDPLAAFREVNVAGTRRLAEQAAEAGVRRMIFVSSVKVNGEATSLGEPFSADDIAAPGDAYGLSKWEAEQALWEVARNTGLEVVVVRPPLVYGPGVKGNFAQLIHWVRKGIPLPLGAVRNQRSLVGLDNLVDLLIRCIEHPQAAGQTFLASDGEDISTPELIRRLARAMNRPARLVSVPPPLMLAGARLLSRAAVAERLLGSLQVDITHTCRTLDWTPPVSVDEGLARAVAG